MPDFRPYQLTELADLPHVVHGFSTSQYSNMSLKWAPGNADGVIQNRKRFLGDLRVRIDDCCLIIVDDIPEVRIITTADRGANMRHQSPAALGDAAITREKNLFLVMLTADCLPVLIVHIGGGAVGIVHQSWRMTDAGLITKAVAQFQTSFDIPPNELIVGIGPGIHQASYRVVKPTQASNPAWRPYLKANTDGTTSVDLVQFTIDQLTESGVQRNKITVSPIDTGSSNEFFSHYQSKRTEKPEARFASVVGLRFDD